MNPHIWLQISFLPCKHPMPYGTINERIFYMKHDTATYTREIIPTPATAGPTLSELQQNPVPENFHLLTGPLPCTMVNDALFHIVLEANPQALKALVCSLLSLPPKAVTSIEVTNPIILGSTLQSKNFVLDIKICLNNHTIINIEMQVVNLSFWKERSLGYLCRTFDNLNKGDDYSNTRPAIHIGILDFEIFKDDTEFYATYHLANDISHKIYSDKFRLSVLQLNQMEHATKEDIDCGRALWAKFFKATTWEEVHMLAEQDPIIADAAKTIYRVTQDERIFNYCNSREMGERTHRTLVNQLAEQGEQLQKLRQKDKDKIQRKIAKGKNLEQIADELEEEIETIRPLYDELMGSPKPSEHTITDK